MYYELWVAFDRIDTNDDMKISKAEFIKAKDSLEQWGIDMSNPDDEWKRADLNVSGSLMFDEFLDWAFARGLDINDDDDAL